MMDSVITWTASQLQIFVILSSTVAVIYIWLRMYNKKQSKNVLPSLRGPSLAQNYVMMKSIIKRSKAFDDYFLSLFLQFLCGLCHMFKNEKIFQIIISLQKYVMFYKPETVEVVLSSTQIIDKAKVYRFLHPALRTGLLTSTGKKWFQRRRLLTPTFHFKILQDFMPVFNRQSNILISRLKSEQDSPWIDIFPFINCCTLDMICETAMGVSINSQSGESLDYAESIHEGTNIFMFRIIQPWLYLDFIFNLSSQGKKFNKQLKTFLEYNRKVIMQKKKEMIKNMSLKDKNENTTDESNIKSHKVFLELLLEHHLKDPSFTEEDVLEEVATFLVEGHDTTAMTLCWTLYHLGLQENIQRQVHQELEEIFEGDCEREITLADLTSMKYLECVLKETLRIYPSVPFFAREVKESFEIDDYTVEKGATCFIFTWMLHRDPESFPDPEKFDPERFFPENIVKRNPYAYIPFSAGPRNCIGQKFAMLEMKVVLASILRNFKVTSMDPRDRVNVVPTLILRSLEPLRLKIESIH